VTSPAEDGSDDGSGSSIDDEDGLPASEQKPLGVVRGSKRDAPVPAPTKKLKK
jgi:hypothetical protein